MNSISQYGKMKDSGIKWIGKVPADWNIRRLYQIVTRVNKKNAELAEQNLLSLSYGKIKRRDINTKDGLLPASFDGYNIIESGDIVLRLTDLQNDQTSLRVGHATEKGIITSAYTTIRPINPAHSDYLYYLIHAFDLKKGFYGMGSGVRQGLNYDEVKELRIVIPSQEEQNAIVAYLDDQCTQIDSLVQEAKETIEEYKKWRAAIIFEAVTKGLNKSVAMRDSGIDWIGEVPEHWKIMRLKHCLQCKKNAMKVGPFGSHLKNSDYVDFGYPVYTQRTVLDNNFTDNNIYISEKKYEELSGFKLDPLDVLVTTRGSIGKIAIAPTDLVKGIIHPCVIKFSINRKKVLDSFLLHVFNGTSLVLEQLIYASNATTIDVVYSEPLKNIKLPVPPLDEQKQIATYLDKKCATIDEIIAEKESLISDLESYKKSLIYETVTGKRKVVQA